MSAGAGVVGGSVRVAAVQALAHTGRDEHKNLALAVAYAEEAASRGAQLIAFPECFPGPATGSLDWDGLLDDVNGALGDLAKRLGVYIAAGGLERDSVDNQALHTSQKLFGPGGTVLANYHRVQPDNPDMNAFFFGGRRQIRPGNEIPVVPTRVGRIGLQVCGELWVPELSRIQMLDGAELILAPVNGRPTTTRLRGMWQTWQHIARARAAENLVYVIVAQKFLVDGPLGGTAMIAGPEAMVARATRPGVLIADLDLERLHWLRSRLVDAELLQPPTSENDPMRAGSRCGQQADRRPELYGALVAPQKDAYDFDRNE